MITPAPDHHLWPAQTLTGYLHSHGVLAGFGFSTGNGCISPWPPGCGGRSLRLAVEFGAPAKGGRGFVVAEEFDLDGVEEIGGGVDFGPGKRPGEAGRVTFG